MLHILFAVLLSVINARPGLVDGDGFNLQEEHVLSKPMFLAGVVSIRKDGEHVCTGVLINPTTVLTDIKCEYQPSWPLAVIYYPTNDAYSLQMDFKFEFKVTSVHTGPGDSIALWKVQMRVGQPAFIPNPVFGLDDGTHTTDGSIISHVRWNLSVQNPFRTDMLIAHMETVSPEACNAKFNDVSPLDICAVQFGTHREIMTNYFIDRLFFLSTMGYNAAETGTPVFSLTQDLKIYLVGIASNARCDFKNYPCVTFRVSTALHWIRPLL